MITTTSTPGASTSTVAPRPLLLALVAVQFFLGYEWLMSGLSKVMAGDFAASLAGTMTDATKEQTGWYKSFIDSVVVPNGQLFGYLVMAGELAVGAVVILVSLTWLVRWSRLSSRTLSVLLGLVFLTGIVGSFMSLNFHLAMGATPPWQISPDPNDQGVDLDSLMAVIQVVLAVASLRYLLSLRRASRSS